MVAEAQNNLIESPQTGGNALLTAYPTDKLV